MKIEIEVPDGKSGDWKVSTFTITEEQSSISKIRDGYRFVEPGEYKRLSKSGETIMSNTRAEILDHSYFIHKVETMGGNVLINGLGLGMCIKGIQHNTNIDQIHVIESSEDVIKLVAPTYENDKRIKIIHANAFEYKSKFEYSVVWHDIWPNITSDNLTEMTKLHRKYGRKSVWQGSWCKEECKRMREREKNI